MRQPNPDQGYDVCIAAVPKSAPVTWEPGGFEPTDALWLEEDEYWAIADAAPLLRSVPLYEQSRHGPEFCSKLLDQLSSARDRPAGLALEALIDDLRGLVGRVMDSSGTNDLMIDGP